MITIIPGMLGPTELYEVLSKLNQMRFVDGASTAGPGARSVKNNLQADMSAPDYFELSRFVADKLMANETFTIAALPRRLTRVRFNLYHDAMNYGSHVDASTIEDVRTDVSFTLFLAEPETYQGGELVIEDAAGDRAFKLKAGDIILYPGTTLHRVEPVTTGERVAAFGWIQSAVRDDAKRELLYDLDLTRRSLFEQHGKSREVDMLGKTRGNLIRMWADI
jgi:PKHD-type hydroxylase